MSGQYDVIVIGTGPNGLEIGAYLSKAGQKVLLLEKRYEAGGGLATEQITLPDFFHNTHAIFHMMVDYAPIYHDFKLEEQYGVRHIRPELQWAMPLPDGKCICVYTDPEKTHASIAKFSKKRCRCLSQYVSRVRRTHEGAGWPSDIRQTRASSPYGGTSGDVRGRQETDRFLRADS